MKYLLLGRDSETTFDFAINKILATIVWGSTELKYNGQAQVPTATANGETLIVNVEGEAEAIEIGTYTAVVTDTSGNFALIGQVKKQFSIVKGTNSIVNTDTLDQWLQGDKTSAPVLQTQFGTPVITYKSADGTVLDTLPTEAGVYTIVITVAGTAQYDALTIERQFIVEAQEPASAQTLYITLIVIFSVLVVVEVVFLVLKIKGVNLIPKKKSDDN